ncbi:hypothetical protein BHE74_00022354, partial [Ensete ventricosum]
SFNDKPVNNNAVGPMRKELFEKEQEDLLSDLKDIPKKACDRKVQKDYRLPPGDLPDVQRFKEVLSNYSIDRFQKLKPKLIQAIPVETVPTLPVPIDGHHRRHRRASIPPLVIRFFLSSSSSALAHGRFLDGSRRLRGGQGCRITLRSSH